MKPTGAYLHFRPPLIILTLFGLFASVVAAVPRAALAQDGAQGGSIFLIEDRPGNTFTVIDGFRFWTGDCRAPLLDVGIDLVSAASWTEIGSLPTLESPPSCSELLSLFDEAEQPDLPIDVATSPSYLPQAGVEIVDVPNSSSIWALEDISGAVQWLNSECKSQLLAAGVTPRTTDLATIGDAPLMHDSRSCDEYLPGFEAPYVTSGLITSDKVVAGSDGWIDRSDGARQYVSPACRETLETIGLHFEVHSWSDISSVSHASHGNSVSCRALVRATPAFDDSLASATAKAILSGAPAAFDHVDDEAAQGHGELSSELDGVQLGVVVSSTDALVEAVAPGQEITIPGETADVTLTLPNSSIEIALVSPQDGSPVEAAKPGTVSYLGEDGAAHTPIIHDDGTVRLVTAIAGESSPERYDFELTLPEGAALDLAGDGSVAVNDVNGLPLGLLTPGWARDQSGTAVPTWFEIDGTTVTQVVKHRGGEFDYPVVFDPWWLAGVVVAAKWATIRCVGAAMAEAGWYKVSRQWNYWTARSAVNTCLIGAVGGWVPWAWKRWVRYKLLGPITRYIVWIINRYY